MRRIVKRYQKARVRLPGRAASGRSARKHPRRGAPGRVSSSFLSLTFPQSRDRYRPGQAFHFNVAIGYQVKGDFTVGLTAYSFNQFTDDNLIRGTIIHVVQENAAAGMSEIQVPGRPRTFWTLKKFLSRSPVTDTLGVVETPRTSNMIQTGILPPGLLNTAATSSATPKADAYNGSR